MTLYICDPEKNTGCKKTSCATYSREFPFCYMTTEEKFAIRDENGQPIKAEGVEEDASKDNAYGIIARHKQRLTAQNVNDYDVSLNPDNIMLVKIKRKGGEMNGT